MPWRCPACQIPIQHSEAEPRPRPRTIYRCHICRLELVVDPETEKLTIAPLADRANDGVPRTKAD